MKIGITVGDINGIGIEVIIKALSNRKLLKMITPIIYGSSKVVSFYKKRMDEDFSFVNCSSAQKAIPEKINIVTCWDEEANITPGKPTKEGGKYAHIALDRACQEAKEGYIDAIVTAPINKSVMDEQAFPYGGHTEYLTKYFKSEDSLMTLVDGNLRVALVSNHIPLSEVPSYVTKENVQRKLSIFENALIKDFGIIKPIIAVLGLNPHAGDSGRIGTEDQEIITPIILGEKEKGKFITGPYPADGFFGAGLFRKVDGILAMYHDQGLVPFKTLAFGRGVNFTAGLPIVRTSPDHGTAYDLVGTNTANPGSMISAIFKAIDIVRERKEYDELRENAIGKKPKQSEEVQE